MAVRIIVDLKRFVADERVMTYILIDSKYKTISEIEARISRLLGTSEPFCLCIGSVMLPSDETVQILYPEEIVTVVRLNPMSRNQMAPRQNYNIPMASVYHHMNYPEFSDDSGDDDEPRLTGPNIPIIAHERKSTQNNDDIDTGYTISSEEESDFESYRKSQRKLSYSDDSL